MQAAYILTAMIAICSLNKRVSPLIHHTKEIYVVSFKRKKRPEIQTIHMSSRLTPSILMDILKNQNAKALICGGIKEEFREALKDNNIECIDNVIGDIDDVIKTYINGNFVQKANKLKQLDTK